MNIKAVFFLLLICLNSCSKECTLKRIPENIFELKKIKEQNVLSCGNESNKLIFTDEYDIYTKESYKGIMKLEECGHSKSYTCEFRKEPIQVCLDKNNENNLELSIYGWFNNLSDTESIILTENELSRNKEYVFQRNTNCDSVKSKIKEVVIKGYMIKSITTLDNKKWTLN
jgi:hypothetical protein